MKKLTTILLIIAGATFAAMAQNNYALLSVSQTVTNGGTADLESLFKLAGTPDGAGKVALQVSYVAAAVGTNALNPTGGKLLLGYSLSLDGNTYTASGSVTNALSTNVVTVISTLDVGSARWLRLDSLKNTDTNISNASASVTLGQHQK